MSMEQKKIIIIQRGSFADPENERQTLYYTINIRIASEPSFQIEYKPFYRTKAGMNYNIHSDFLNAEEFERLLETTFQDAISSSIIQYGNILNKWILRRRQAGYEAGLNLFTDINEAKDLGVIEKKVGYEGEVTGNDIFHAYSALRGQFFVTLDSLNNLSFTDTDLIYLLTESLNSVIENHPNIDLSVAKEKLLELGQVFVREYNSSFYNPIIKEL